MKKNIGEKNFKVREYYRKGRKEGYLKKELYFETLEDAAAYYKSVFVYGDFGLNPTIWELKNNNWQRIEGF